MTCRLHGIEDTTGIEILYDLILYIKSTRCVRSTYCYNLNNDPCSEGDTCRDTYFQ